MKFIVLEGLDGAGKSTQVELLKQWFEENGKKFKFLHFPRMEAPYYGEMIARFLRGDFGNLNDVDPYLVALLYAGDRRDASSLIEKWIKEKYYVIVDRYVYSNIAYQCAKLNSVEEQEKLKNWILDLEFNYNKIIKPDISLFLNVPFDFTKESLTKDRKGEDRNYLKGKQDIHEANLNFQKNVRNIYMNLLKEQNDFIDINCIDNNGNMLDKNKIFAQIKNVVEQTLHL